MAFLRRSKHAFLLLALLVGFVACGSHQSSSPNPLASGNVAAHTFAFWYESWDPKTTPAELKPADVAIGLAPAAVSRAHAAHKLVLQYQTYYQAVPGSLLLSGIADLANVGFQINHQLLPTVFGTPNSYVMCPSSTLMHQRVQKYVQLAFASGYDGLFVDNTFFDPAAHAICDSAHQHVDAPSLGGDTYLQLLSEVRQTVKSHNPNAILMTNPGDPDWASQIAAGSPTLWDLSDYVVWESYGYSSVTDVRHDDWNNTIAKSFRYATMFPDRAAKIVALSYPMNLSEARYAFAVARFFGLNWTANLGVNQSAGHFGAFLDQIPFQLGNPTGPLPAPGPVLQRAFQHGQIFVNADSAPQSITVPAGTIYLGSTTVQVAVRTDLTVQPRTAAIVITP